MVNNTSKSHEEAIVILRFKHYITYFIMLAVLGCGVLFSFGTIVPYMMTFDFNQIWPANSGGEGKKAVLFVLSWVFWFYSPTLIAIFTAGDIYLYDDFVAVKPILPFFKKRVVCYEGLHVRIRKGRGMLLTNAIVPKWWRSPFKYWKIISFYGVGIPFSNMALKNPESLQIAIEKIQREAKTTSVF